MATRKEKRAAYQKKYSEKHREKLKEYRKLWMRRKRAKDKGLKIKVETVSIRSRKIPKGKCQRCEILLKSKFAGFHDNVHCEDCINELGQSYSPS